MKKIAVILLMAASSTVMIAQNQGKVKHNKNKTAEERIENRVEKMSKELGLSEEQSTQVLAAMQAKTAVIATSHQVIKEAKNNIEEANRNFYIELEKVLTSTQLEKFKESEEARKEERKNHPKKK